MEVEQLELEGRGQKTTDHPVSVWNASVFLSGGIPTLRTSCQV